MDLRNIWIFVLCLSLISCVDSGTSVEEERQVLDEMRTEIETIANSEACINASDWLFTAIGAKACGGAAGYIAYSNKIDVDLFLNLVAAYTAAEKKFNKKWGIISDCSIVMPPTGINCEDGKPVFYYNF